MPVFTYDTGKLLDVDIHTDDRWIVSVVHEDDHDTRRYSVVFDTDLGSGDSKCSISDLLDKLGHRVWIKYRVRKVWNEDGTSRTDRVLIDIDEIGDVMNTKSRFWEWSLLPTIGIFSLILSVVLAVTAIGRVMPAKAATRQATILLANADLDGNTEIVKMEVPDGPLMNISKNDATDHSPALSPDGSQIAFVSNRETGTENVWIMKSDGSDARNLTYLSVIGAAISKDPAWSPDGSMIAFSSTRYGTSDIWLASADGLNSWSVTWDSRIDSQPAFSADGTRIYFASDGQIVSVALDGSDRQVLSDPAAVDALGDYNPVAAPNGTHIAFWRYSYHDGSKLMLMRTDGSESRVLDAGNGVSREPAWLADSTTLVFVSDKDRSTRGTGARTDAYTYDINTGKTTRLTRSGKDFGKPTLFTAEITEPDSGTSGDPGDSDVRSDTPPTSAFYFAEGTVRPGFVQFLTIQNPNGTNAEIQIEYQAANDAGSPVTIPGQTLNVGPDSRATVNVNDYLIANQVPTPVNVSTKVTSSSVIIAERAIYFSFDPGIGRKVNGGTAVAGASGPALIWRFAEGTVRPGFVQYFTIQNPGNDTATVTIAYQVSTDSGAPVSVPAQSVTIAPRSRATVNVNHYFSASGVTSPVNVSAAISSNVPVVAERPVYFSADPALGSTVDGGTVVVGKAA